MFEPFQYEFFVRGIIAGALVGALCGLVGVYIVLRKMAYIGHGLAHAIFGGAVVSYVMAINFYVGASLWGFLSAVLISLASRKRQISNDAAIGIVTTASFALGIAIISRYKSFTRSFDAALFGNILGITNGDLIAIAVVALLCSLIMFFWYKRFLFLIFDEEVARVYRLPVTIIDTIFSLILAATVVVSIQILGVTLIAAAVVIPPVTARLLSNNFHKVIFISVALGSLYSVAGMYLSYYFDISSGAAIVLFATFWFLCISGYSWLRNR